MNKFALLDEDGFTEPKKVEQKKAAPAAAKAPAAPKVAAAKAADKKPVGEKKPFVGKDRHTKGGRDAGAAAPEGERKKFHDRSLPRHDKRQTERKGAERSNVKGGTASRDPTADQVTTDVEQKKDEEEAKKEEEAAVVEEKKEEEKKEEEPKAFLLADALKARNLVVGETKKVAKAKNVATTEALNEGTRQKNTVIFTKAQPKKINANKKVFTMDEFQAVTASTRGAAQPQEYRKKKESREAAFPAL